ncbi:heparinase II/III family protein [Sediminitomix flava]|uniref:Heparinase II/III-like protein n=1 Tax=Sediminitomix flava TaxID=379075 RepID=A0A315Z570_SEDFL|nr:heparinase II/III family protein [Sediminitomix flava]PWJ38417.1 heparinase II/III-like protein [Sediminitomix flava]
MKLVKVFLGILTLFFFNEAVSANDKIPSRKVISNENLYAYLKTDVRKNLNAEDGISEEALAKYFREVFAEKFFYDWKNVDARFKQYENLYQVQSKHTNRAKDHLKKFNADTHWKLPFKYQNGKEVNAYALRHLARQHKMLDIAFLYFYDDKNPKYVDYFTKQLQSLNSSLDKDQYEKIEDGNGVYEAFRSGYRVLNWLSIHNLFLGESEYSDEDQLRTVATFIQHAQHLYETNAKFKSGNHQTRGMSALAMLSIIFSDFKGSEAWFDRAMTRLNEHLSNEINEDGFQFERSVHYHMSDISNYFYVYQLARINEIELSQEWLVKLKSLFTTLVKIAYPDKTAPVLQDDTDKPWAEKNDISGTMTLGYLLFEEPQFGYFANNKVDDKLYWFLKESQLEDLKNIRKDSPSFGAVNFDKTHYYIMREGWEKDDKMMIISAGVDSKKPDHQHGDILGIQAMANGNVILPNYQVRYSLDDYELFKNSKVKNVALVDDILQGQQWTSNKGGSGFGKFKKLPKPSVLKWDSNKYFDLFVGKHDGFEENGVHYSRQVIYIKDKFWIVKDNFKSDTEHTYKQVWQGHYTKESKEGLIRSSFSNGAGCDILQLNVIDSISKDGSRGKEWSIISKNGIEENFISIIYPYNSYSKRLDETSEHLKIDDWKLNELNYEAKGNNLVSLVDDEKSILFGVKYFSLNGIKVEFSNEVDVFVRNKKDYITLKIIGDQGANLNISGVSKITKVKKEVNENNFRLEIDEELKCTK